MPTSKRVKNNELEKLVFAADSTIHGTGLFANRKIRKGEYIGTYWGPQTSSNDIYVLWVYEDQDDESSAIGRDGKNLLRFLNHSVPGNTEFDGFDLYARISIKQGEELTFDYQESEFD